MIELPKTYKLYIGGKFPRSESGRSYQPVGCPDLHVARSSRKDLRDAIVGARGALSKWASAPGYLQGQILYRIGEMLSSRRAGMRDELLAVGLSEAAADKELDTSLELLSWYAGLPDKLQTLLGSQNEVPGPYFNFSTVEATGVVGVVPPSVSPLAGLLALVLPLIAAGNTVVALTDEVKPLPGLALGEVLASSDVPGGVVNLLSGLRGELLPQMASHRDLDGMLLAGPPEPEVGQAAAETITRVRYADVPDRHWREAKRLCRLDWVAPFAEVKTFWHPVAP